MGFHLQGGAAGKTGGVSCMFALEIQILEYVRNSGVTQVPGHRGNPVPVTSQDISALDCLISKPWEAGKGTDGVLFRVRCHFLPFNPLSIFFFFPLSC